MTRLRNHFLIIFLVCAASAALVSGQDSRVIGGLEFEGLQHMTAGDVLARSGLKVGQPFKVEEVDDAAQRLLDSGLFTKLAYRTRTAGNKVTITFQVEEASGGDSPVVFDNFIWFTAEQLRDAVRLEVPSFTGRAPNTGKMPEAITRALQQLLTKENLAGKVEYLASQDLAGHMLKHVFSVTGVKMPMCSFRFPGAQNVPTERLGAFAQELGNADYSAELVQGFAEMKLMSLYREVGQLRAKFDTPTGKPDPRCKNGVNVTIPVTEGLVYSWGQISWSGIKALTAEELNPILGITSGEVANGVKFDKGVTAVVKAYGRQGYLDARVRPTAEFSDTGQKVTYKIDVQEGRQYRMGSLLFGRIAERDAKALRSAWKLRRGEIFDQGYLSDFFMNDSQGVMQRLSEERGGKPPKLEANVSPNKETLTVDVTLELVN